MEPNNNLVRTHISTQPEIDRTYIYTQEGLEFGDKPCGLWYSFGEGWLDWCRSDFQSWIGPYQFDLEIDTSRILVISTREELVEFCKKYAYHIGENEGLRNHFIGIDWNRVIQEYAGIEFLNYHQLRRSLTYENDGHRVHMVWLCSLSIDSGCIWDLSIIRGLERKDVPEAAEGAGRYPAPDTF